MFRNDPIANHIKVNFINGDASPFNIHEISPRNLRWWAINRGAKTSGDKELPVVYIVDEKYLIVGICVDHGYGSGWPRNMENIYDVHILSINGTGEDMYSFDRNKFLKQYDYHCWGEEFYIEVTKTSPIFISYEDAKTYQNILLRKKIHALDDIISENKRQLELIHNGNISIRVEGISSECGSYKMSVNCVTSDRGGNRGVFSHEVTIEMQEIFSKKITENIESHQKIRDKLVKKLL